MPETNNKLIELNMILLHPPLTKPCEPPAALAYLAGYLRRHGISCVPCDLNIEAIGYLLAHAEPADDTWSRRAFKNLRSNRQALQDHATYLNRDKYKRAVSDINRILEITGKKHGVSLSLSNYSDNTLSPLNSDDLRRAAAHFKENIFYPYFSERLEGLIDAHQPNNIGISINYISQAIVAMAIVGFLKTNNPHLKIIAGGGLITTWISHPNWRNPFIGLIDHVIGGKGEKPLLDLLGRKQKVTHVPPDFEGLPLENYLSPGTILPYASSTGCYWKKCSFCPEKTENTPYIHIPPDQTVEDLSQLSSTINPSLIHMLDNAISPSTLKALAKPGLPVPWYGFARFDKLLTDKDFCVQLRESGCVMLKLGLESGDQQVLDTMNKGIDLHMAEQVLQNLHDAGIATYIYLLFGTPAETTASCERTLSLVEALSPQITFLNLAIFNLPLFSEEASALEISNFYHADLSIYSDFKHPAGMDRKTIRQFLTTRFRRSAKITPILQADPPFFSSNHAPFFSKSFPHRGKQ